MFTSSSPLAGDPNPFSVRQKSLLITGASSGIGRAIAKECASLGASVVLSARQSGRLDEAFSDLSGSGHQKWPYDLLGGLDQDSSFDGLPVFDGVVLCAGTLETTPVRFLTQEKIEALMKVNFTGQALLCQRLVAAKKLRTGASIVWMSSVFGRGNAAAGNSVYSASKGAVEAFARGMALELAPRGVRVNCVAPGMIETDLYRNGSLTEEELEADRARYPLKRYGQPREVAHATIFLLSDASAWITGSSLLIDGGLSIT